MGITGKAAALENVSHYGEGLQICSQCGGEHLQTQRNSEETSGFCFVFPWQGSADGTHTQPQELPTPLE